MRRPLFWVALFLVIIAVVRLEFGDLDGAPPGMISAHGLGDRQQLTVTGQVYKKDDHTLYLQDVSVCLQNIEGFEDPFQIAVSEAGFSRQSISCNDNIICKLTQDESIPLGSYVTLEGSFAPILAATNPGEFDAAAFYRTMGVGGRLSRASLLAKGQSHWPMREGLYQMRLYLEGRLYRALPEKPAGIMCALLLGDRGGLEERVEDLYRQGGILHILSISSLHITILGMSVYHLLRRIRVPVAPAAIAGSILLLGYGCLTGFGVSACRAIGMYLIRMLGKVLGRTYDMLTALGVMGALMVWHNPYYLYHSGFLLSFASVLGVSVLYPALAEGRKAEGKQAGSRNRIIEMFRSIWDKLRQSALVSLSVVFATLPVQLWCSYEAPVYSVFLNLLVLPLVKPLMLAGFLVMVFPWLGPAGVAAGCILDWYEWLCELCRRLPFHTWNPGCPKIWQIIVYYLLLGAVGTVRKKIRMFAASQEERTKTTGSAEGSKDRKRRAVIRQRYWRIWIQAGTAGGLLCAVLALGFRGETGNRVTFLDVGQGDCILVQTASGENYLFDCGSSSRAGVGEYVLLPFLKYSGIQELDAVLISHPDADHTNGIAELLNMGQESGVAVRQLVLPGIAQELREEQLGELLAAARRTGQINPVDIHYVCAGDVWECGSARFTCLNPVEEWEVTDANAYSECFYVEFFQNMSGDRKEQEVATLLLTGDVEGEGEEALLKQLAQRNIGQVDVLKVAHHGSRGASSKALLKQVHPRISVISCGRNNRYGHPHAELLERLEDCGCLIYQTQESGAVTVRVKDGKVSVEGFLDSFN